MKKNKNIGFLLITIIVSTIVAVPELFAQNIPIPSFNLEVGQSDNPDQVASALQVIALLTILTLAPAILIMTTSFTRIVIVLSFLRNALGTQQSPPSQVIVGFSMFLTFFSLYKQQLNKFWKIHRNLLYIKRIIKMYQEYNINIIMI